MQNRDGPGGDGTGDGASGRGKMWQVCGLAATLLITFYYNVLVGVIFMVFAMLNDFFLCAQQYRPLFLFLLLFSVVYADCVALPSPE